MLYWVIVIFYLSFIFMFSTTFEDKSDRVGLATLGILLMCLFVYYGAK